MNVSLQKISKQLLLRYNKEFSPLMFFKGAAKDLSLKLCVLFHVELSLFSLPC